METREEMVAGAVAVPMTGLSEHELVREAQALSQEAWGHIYDRYYTKIFDYCYVRTGDRAASEDLASDVFLEALRGIHRFRYRGVPIVSWLYRIAHNLTVDHLRRKARRPTVALADEHQESRLQVPDSTDRAAVRRDIEDAVRQLTGEQQQVVLLRFFHGLSHDEVATVMGRRPGAVRALQNRALHALRRLMVA